MITIHIPRHDQVASDFDNLSGSAILFPETGKAKARWVKEMFGYFAQCIRNGEDCTVYTFSSALVNVLGFMIVTGLIPHDSARVITEYGVHTYAKDGFIEGTWPYGYTKCPYDSLDKSLFDIA